MLTEKAVEPLGIIGGTGLTQLANLRITRRQVGRTPYGEPSGALTFGRIGEREVIFLARHGYGHTIPPHEVNYRANIWALKQEGVQHIVAVASVGGIGDEFTPGVLAVPHQVLDYTYGRKHTYFEGADRPVTHIDFTHPYCESLRQELLAAAVNADEAMLSHGVYAATQGPRLETAAEIDRLVTSGAAKIAV